ncbi:MAG: GTP cyclohydrolase MptA [Anaerolineae bacterium]|nr:GTP cyclohydrolase MptA [Anaerolineae bacterium]
MHTVYLGLGANLGDRQHNLAEALQRLRAYVQVEAVSSCYETKPVGYTEQPNFINLACRILTDRSPHDLLRLVKGIEQRMGRLATFRYGPRLIDIDILLYDDLTLDTPELTIPHPRMAERAFVLVPLAELAADVRHPVLGLTIAELLERVDRSGVWPASRCLELRLEADRQESRPKVVIGLSRVGVTNLERIIRLTGKGKDNLFYATVDLFVSLKPDKTGAHMSRFSDQLERVVERMEVLAAPDIESFAEALATRVVESQGALQAEVHVRAKFPVRRAAPISGMATQSIHTLIGLAVAGPTGVRRAVGVEVDGLTACPCAQDMVRTYAHQLIQEEMGLEADAIERVLDLVPLATHNQRGRGTLIVGTRGEVQAFDLVHLVEQSMSSEIYELLKRTDEFFVVHKAHRHPRFVEDVVRERLHLALEAYADLPDDDFLLARQENFESIHRHNVLAEHSGTFGELRRALREGQPLPRTTTLQEWLGLGTGGV